jgi:hypothetical protein
MRARQRERERESNETKKARKLIDKRRQEMKTDRQTD